MDEKPEAGKAKSPSMAGGRVLYIEDNPANMILMESLIDRISGVELIPAETAEIGLVLARAEPPDLVLMDINLPGMDGISALKELRAMEETKTIPVVAVSAAAMPQDIERAIEAGFEQYITKPINLRQAIEIIKQYLTTDGA
ncbi:MAG: response regulator [Proteobacteria bacterium]|nr:response regulator [Pseudomonadota bacterium]